MAWSRILLPDGDPLPDEFHRGHVLIIHDGEQTSLLVGREMLDFAEAGPPALEDALKGGAGAGAPVHRAALAAFADCGEVLACGEGLEIRTLAEREFQERLEPIAVSRLPIGRVGGPRAAELLLLVDRELAPRPAMRRLVGMPAERVAGLMPFLTAVGAEPYVILDEVAPLVDELDRRGGDWVAALGRPGAFLWKLDLRGREGVDRLGPQRIDDDVILPLTGGLEALDHVQIGGDLGDLVLEARRGDFDLAFVFPRVPPPILDQLEEGGVSASFLVAPELPGSLCLL